MFFYELLFPWEDEITDCRCPPAGDVFLAHAVPIWVHRATGGGADRVASSLTFTRWYCARAVTRTNPSTPAITPTTSTTSSYRAEARSPRPPAVAAMAAVRPVLTNYPVRALIIANRGAAGVLGSHSRHSSDGAGHHSQPEHRPAGSQSLFLYQEVLQPPPYLWYELPPLRHSDRFSSRLK